MKPCIYLFLLLAALQFSACAPAGDSKKKDLPEAQASVFTTFKASEDPWVHASERVCMMDDFRRYVHQGTTSQHDSIRTRLMQFPVKAYKDAVDSIPLCLLPYQAGILVHVGLDEQGLFDVALEFLCLTEVGVYTYDPVPGTGYYTIGNNTLIPRAGDVRDWTSTYGQRYRESVILQDSTDAVFRNYIDSVDVDSIFFPHEEIFSLIRHNQLADTRLLRIHPVAGAQKRTNRGSDYFEEEIRQGVCWIGVGVTLNNDTAIVGQEFRNKGADLGAPCPEACPPNVRFARSGPERRNGC